MSVEYAVRSAQGQADKLLVIGYWLLGVPAAQLIALDLFHCYLLPATYYFDIIHSSCTGDIQ
jgi:hypothetical protein